MATSKKNTKTKAERATIRKGKSAAPAEFKRILAEGPGKSGDIVTTAGTPSMVSESAKRRISREDAAANFRDRQERITEYARRVKAKEMELKDVPKTFRDSVSKDLGVKPIQRKVTVKRPAAKPEKTTSQVVDDARSAAKKETAKSTPKPTRAPVARPSSGAKSTATSAPSTASKTQTKPKSTAKKFVETKQAELPGMSDSSKVVKGGRTKAPAASTSAKSTGVAEKVSKYVQSTIEDIGKADKGAIVKEALVGKGKAGRFKAAGGFSGAVGAALSVAALASAAKDVPGKVKKFMDKYTEPKRLPAHPTKMNVSKTAAVKSTTARPVFSRPNATKTKPSSTAAPTAAKSGTHAVSKGDTLWAIAKANNTSVDAILKVNPELAKRKAAGKTMLFTGTKVRIPKN